jgi:hypothetical protein
VAEEWTSGSKGPGGHPLEQPVGDGTLSDRDDRQEVYTEWYLVIEETGGCRGAAVAEHGR